MKKNSNNTVIINAPDPKIFNRENRIKFERNRKTRVIATSWSANWRKGFDIYQYLDENLDFSKYEMTFVGNSPVKFKNIKCIKPLDSRRLAEQLKQQDIFITASKKDPCSNSLIEALHCGLPAIALNDGGHPEIIGKGGEVFVSNKDVIKKIEIVTKNYHYYQDQIRLQNIDAAGETYYQFIKSIFSKYENKEYFPKKVYLHQCLRLLLSIYGWQLKSKFRSLIG